MGRNNKKEGIKTVNIVFPDHMSADEIKHIIADGLMEFEERKRKRGEEEEKVRVEEWQQAIGVEDFSNVKQPRRRWLTFKSNVKTFWKMCTISPKYIKGEGLTLGLMQGLLELFFGMLNVGFLLVSLILCVVGLVFLLQNGISFVSIVILAGLWAYGLLSFVLSRVFRIARFEAANISDRNYLFGLFACITSLITIAIATATLFVTLRKG